MASGPFSLKVTNKIANPIRVALADFTSDFRMDVAAGAENVAANVLFEAGHYAVIAMDALSSSHPVIATTHINMQGETLLIVKPNSISGL